MTWIKSVLAASIALIVLTSPASGGPYLPSIQKGTVAVTLQPVATEMSAPDYAISPPGDTSRLFVVEQNGLLRILQNGSLLPGAALDISGRVTPPLNPGTANDERGFLGLAFHPDFNNDSSPGFRTLYTYNSEPLAAGATYPAPNGAAQNYKNVINEWKMSAADPNVVDPLSWREIISFSKTAGNHNGGTIAFGPDGYLYLALGDGGNANDVGVSHIEPGGNAQSPLTPLGKMIRIDPLHPSLTSGPNPISANGQYRIPTTNPIYGAGQVPEIYAVGFRNPYRFSFDTANGELILADVGQNNIEEIDRVVAGGNYGWAVKEGDFLFDRATGTIGAPPGNRSPGLPAGLIDPISGPMGTLEYDHGDGISITGGFVYRGSAIPELFGKYVFGDLALRNLPPRVDGRLFYADLTSGEINEFLLPQFSEGILPNGLTVHGFGQDGSGELYALVTNTPANGNGGIVYKFMPVPEPDGIVLMLSLGLLMTELSRGIMEAARRACRSHLVGIVTAAICLCAANSVSATVHLWHISELYSNTDGSVQYIELYTDFDGQQYFKSLSNNVAFNSQNSSATMLHASYSVPNDSPSPTGGHHLLFGTANLAATLDVTPDYTLPVGFLLTGGGYLEVHSDNQGDFAAALYPALPGGSSAFYPGSGFDTGTPTNYAGVTGSFPSPAIPGDFDGDNDVDGADFVAWQTHFPTASGATLQTGDADADGDVDGADFVVWQTHFPTSAGSAVVPEPPALLPAAIPGLIALIALARKRTSC